MLQKLFSSRTVWMIVLMFLIGGMESIAQFIPDSFETVILGGLGLLAAYFRANTKVDFES